jgi:hypothetical protein
MFLTNEYSVNGIDHTKILDLLKVVIAANCFSFNKNYFL